MAVSKNPLIRYKVLDNCFRNPGRRFFINDLIGECCAVLQEIDPDKSISRRQVLEDITFMESSEGWSIDLERHKDGKRVYYRYADLSYSIFNMPLNDIEIKQIHSALDVLSNFKGMPQFEWINDILFKINNVVVNKSKESNIVGFDNNPYLKGLEFMAELFNSILYKKVLEITYQGFKQIKPEKYIFHPYFLKEYNKRWFVLGHCEELEILANYPLDRIIKFKQVNKQFEETDIDFDEYFDDIIGVTRAEGEVEKIVLKFVPEQVPYVLSKPIHGSMKKMKEDMSGLTVSIEVIPNYELESMILSFGNKVELISPNSLRKIILKRLSDAINLY